MPFRLRDSVFSRIALFRIFILTALFAGIGGLVLSDHARVERDFTALKALLRDTRYQAVTRNQTLMVRFSGKNVAVEDNAAWGTPIRK